VAAPVNLRKPKGTYARNTPDYFYRQGYILNQPIPNATPGIVTYLYNSATDGSLLWVYGALAVLNDGDPQDVLTFFLVQNTLGFDFTADSINPIDILSPAPPAKFYYSTSDPHLFDVNLFSISIEAGSAGFFPPGPLYVLRPGYALQMSSGSPTTNYWLNVWFVVLQGE
jgi:hypothetical protein